MPKIGGGMVNRQAVGLYKGKLHQRQAGAHGAGKPEAGKRQQAKAAEPAPAEGVDRERAKKDRIAPSLQKLAVPIASLVPDPMNARLHPERNLEAIMDSLCLYGQRKAVSVVLDKKGRKIVRAGNGTLEAAKALGWTKLAAAVDDDLDEVEAIGYGLADNRTSELAKWDFEVVAKLDRLILEQNHPTVGWTKDELEVLRRHEFTEAPQDFPEVDENIETEHICPRCAYRFSGGEVVEKGKADKNGRMANDNEDS